MNYNFLENFYEGNEMICNNKYIFIDWWKKIFLICYFIIIFRDVNECLIIVWLWGLFIKIFLVEYLL